MVRDQIEARGVRDPRVLDAMREVPREQFVPLDRAKQAHDDCALPIGEGQTISQPYIVGLMLEALALSGEEIVLEIGTGSGYETALLSHLAARVFSVERVAALADECRARLAEFRNVEIVVADGTLGLPDRGPFDAIVVTAAGPSVPQPLVDQLAEGGRLVMPLGSRDEQMLVRLTRHGAETTTTDLCACRFVPLIGAHGFSA
jgi:protein-L-isoaspartate(D-aspartate) O-methyltransferase